MPLIKFDSEAPPESKVIDPRWWEGMILDDLFFFCKVVLRHGKKVEYRDLNWIHRELCNFLDPKRNPVPQLLVLMFRDSLKSSIARAVVIQWFLQARVAKREAKAFYFAGLFELAQDSLEKIVKEMLENKLIQAFFSKIIPNKKTDFDILRLDEGRLRYKGIEIDIGSPQKSLTGHHYELGINDNLCNELNTASSEAKKKTIKIWQAQESILAERAREIIFETPWANDDVSGTILNPEGKFDYRSMRRKACLRFISDTGYAVFSCPATTGEGVIGMPVFPEKVDLEYLERKRRKQGPYMYSALYDLQPTPDEEVIIRREWWDIHYEKLPLNFIRNIYVDAAGTVKKKSSHSAVSIGEWDELGTLYLPYASKRKVTPLELEKWILELVDMSHDEDRPITWLGIEKEKYGIYLKESLEAKRPDLIIILVELRNIPRPKRHDELVPYFETRKILSAPGLKDYNDEMASYYRGKDFNVDIMDTIWGHFQIQFLPKKVNLTRQRFSELSKEEIEDKEFERQVKGAVDQRYGYRQIASMF